MLYTIILKEIREHFISLRFLIIAVICITLIPMSFYVNNRDYQNRIADYNRSLQLNQEKLDNIKPVELFTSDLSIKGYRTPSPLSVFASGLDSAMPQVLDVRKYGLSFQSSSSRNETILTITGKIDFIFIVRTVFTLIALLFSFDAVCGEKENGTLKAALSNAISRNTYIFGKYIGTMITLIVPFVVSFLVGLVLLIAVGYPLFNTEILMRMVLIFISSIFLISVFSCIGLFVSSRVSSSKTSIVILLLIWILLIVVLPGASNIAAQAFIPVDSEEVVHLEKSLLRQNLEREKGREIDVTGKNIPQIDLNRLGSEENERINEERNRVLNPIRREYDRKIHEGISKIEQEASLKRARQQSLALSLARISPAVSFNQLVTNLSWTGEYARKRFISSAQAYQIVLNQVLFNHVYRDISPSGGMSMGLISEVNLKELPVFQHRKEILSDTLYATLLDVVLIIFFSIMMFVLAYVSFLRYDVR